MREAAVATEKKAVERAIRPAWRPGAGSADNSSPGSKASAARSGDVGVDRALVVLGGVGCLGRLQAGSQSL